MNMVFFDAYVCIGPRWGKHPAHAWKLEHVLDEMRHCSIAGALVFNRLCVTYDPMLGNQKLSAALEPHRNLSAIWNVMPHHTREFPEPAELLRLMRRRNVRAVTLYPKTNCWELLSPLNAELLEALARKRILTITHADQFGGYGELETLLQRYPELPVMLNAAGYSEQRYVIPLLKRYKNLYVTFNRFQVHYGLEYLVEMGCEDQLIYSSNAPEMSMGAHRAFVDYASLPGKIKAKIAGGNLKRLLQGLGPEAVRINPNEDGLMRNARLGRPQAIPILDMHTHTIQEGLNGSGAITLYQGGPRGTYALMKRLGYHGAAIMSWELWSGDCLGGNETVKKALDYLPDTYWGAGSFDPAHCSQAELRNMIPALYADKRFLGMKPYHVYGIPYDDPLYAVWWEYGNAHNLYAMMHTAPMDNLKEVDHLAEKHPNVTWVLAHSGASFKQADAAIACMKPHPNVFAEITFTSVTLGVIEYLRDHVGAERILYGSDLPMRDPRQQLGWVVYSRISEAEKIKILGTNTRDIVGKCKAAAAR